MNQASPSPRTVRLAAAGDLLPACRLDGTSPRDLAAGLAPLRDTLAGCDIVLGNLECTVPGDGAIVPTEPRVIANPDAVRAVCSAGFNVVNLANNHAFDCLEGGFRNLRRLLDEMGVAHFGAGDDLAQASAPAILDVRGVRLAFLGAADVRSGPFQQAAPNRPGVAPLELSRMIEQVRALSGQTDHLIVFLHWGCERFLIPSPRQVEQAHALIEAGASMVLGHHPHVVQGMELHRGRPIVYSLGNFVACEVPFSDGDSVVWNRRERTGCLLLADLAKGSLDNVRQVATYDDGQEIRVDASSRGRGILAGANRALARGVSLRRFRRHALWVQTIRPALDHLRWSKLKKFRLGKIRKALVAAGKARGSQ